VKTKHEATDYTHLGDYFSIRVKSQNLTVVEIHPSWQLLFMLPDLQLRGKVLYGCYNRATSKVLSSCTFNFKLLNFSGECKHTKLIDDPWQKVLKFCWPKATPRGNKSGANSLNSESHKNAQRLHQVVWTRYKPHTKPVQQKKHIFFQKNYTLDLLFVCEAPVTTHVLAAIEAWTADNKADMNRISYKFRACCISMKLQRFATTTILR
jgi:hypothetical protein